MEWSRDVPAALPSPLARRWSDRENRVNMLGRLTQSTSVAQQLSEDDMKRRFLWICTAALMLPLFSFQTVQASPKSSLEEVVAEYPKIPLGSNEPKPGIEISKSSNANSRPFFIRTESSTREFIDRIEFHKKNSRLIESRQLLKMYFEVLALADIITEQRRRRGEGFFASAMNDENVQAAAISSIMDERRKAGDLEATFGSSMISYFSCRKMIGLKVDATVWCEKSVEGLRVASEKEDPRAYILLGRMYEEGIWYEKSKFTAAEKYFSAAEIFEKLRDRDRALINVEKAMGLWPNNARFIEFLARISK
jgi:tetratricopeptide (TPR) repeat protein